MSNKIYEEDCDDEEIIEEVDLCKNTDFGLIGQIKRKSGIYERVVIVNRWAWMTDNKYRSIYPPIMEILSKHKCKEKDIALIEVSLSQEEIVNILSNLKMRRNNLLERHALEFFKKRSKK